MLKQEGVKFSPRPRDEIITPLIQKETRKVLEERDLWYQGDAWTEEAIRDLAKLQKSISFEQVVLAVQSFAPERVVQLMNVYALSVWDYDHRKDALEYAALFQQGEVLRRLLERYQGDPVFREWLPVYQLFLDHVVEKKSAPREIIQKARELIGIVQQPILKIRLELLELEECSKIGLVDRVLASEGLSKSHVADIDESFRKSVIISIMLLSKANALLFAQGEPEKAEGRYLAVTVNGATPDSMLVPCHHGLGLATLSKSTRGVVYQKDTCFEHFETAIFYAKRAGLTSYCEKLEKEYYPFARNIYGERIDVEGIALDEAAHQYIVRDEREKALHIINKLEKEKGCDAFLMFYKAKALKNKDLLRLALGQFEKENQAYMLPLVKRELATLNL
ncbi:AimR family lysis-lysogeny pheromone receptor [Shouchella lonarensis]|uniref:Uncharacterized protein n=1 Tax=Shouchella lonarensis TaxID=1464122 RepID=A0A1G6HNW4_9BACI|nr:AimR family lysis-lysogeny pheromone receptor [Shouchella lonarensis]SDB95940.1 hypothetical protein SAMN05421737_104101 [Shouchella lonarensis]